MGAQFLDLLKKVTIFMLAGQIIVQFLPSGGYEKYVKMMISIMVLSQIALPILSLGKFDAQQNFQTALRKYEEEMERISRLV
ncbi:stage III sporulation protein AF, partial [Eisenbergiella porci]|uniref:stage III sporulation protein AF n=1 Tax=Eisenbergiella porci TaxID=2652274 RepID=UPI002A80930C